MYRSLRFPMRWCPSYYYRPFQVCIQAHLLIFSLFAPSANHPFRNRIFFKLSRIIFQDTETDQPVSASLEQGPEASAHSSRISSYSIESHENLSPAGSHRHGDFAAEASKEARSVTGHSLPPLSTDPDMPVAIAKDSLVEADDEAARQILVSQVCA